MSEMHVVDRYGLWLSVKAVP